MNNKEAINFLHSLKFSNREKEFEITHNDNLDLIINLLNLGEATNKKLQITQEKLINLHDFLCLDNEDLSLEFTEELLRLIKEV